MHWISRMAPGVLLWPMSFALQGCGGSAAVQPPPPPDNATIGCAGRQPAMLGIASSGEIRGEWRFV
jgi:hypothetical protein